MKKLMISAVIAIASISAMGQTLPKGSPLGTSTQQVGASTISLEYSRPGVKNREIFGKLLPYGELWRLGANAATKFTTTDTLKFGDNTLAPGTYALFAIPNENGTWELIFNSNAQQSGTADYSSDLDVFRLTVKTTAHSFTETLTLNINNIKNESASLLITWGELKVEVPFTLNTNAIAIRNIEAAIQKGENLAGVYSNAGDFYFNTLKDNKTALLYVEKALKMKEDFRGLFLKARIIAEQGKKDEAITLAKKALAMAEAAGVKGYAGFISGTITGWEK